MNKVLFTHSYFLHFDNKQLQNNSPYPPLGTLYAASYLREKGYDVSVFDTQFSDSPSEIASSIETLKPDFFIIYDDGFNYLTKMCLSNMREAAFQMQKIAKQNNCYVIVCSSDAADNAGLYIEKGADFVIYGEGEDTLLSLTESLKNKAVDFNVVQGIYFKEENGIVKSDKRNVITNLDKLPLPAWDLIDIKPYKDIWLKHHGYFSLNFVTTRGCPYKCNWCAKPIYGNRYNTHSPSNIVNQIKNLQIKWGFTHVWFADDIFGLREDWLSEFAHLVEENHLKIEYKIQSRADLINKANTVELLAKSGCKEVWLGAESGSQRILDAMDKGISVNEIEQSVKLLQSQNIKACLFLQFGYLNEKVNDINQTIQMVQRLLPHDIGVSVSYPLPGTKFYEKVKQDLITKKNWTDSDDLDLMFTNTYQSGFYKSLHRYIHRKFRLAQGLNSLSKFNFFNRRVFLIPYYKVSAIVIKKQMIKLEQDAKAII